jgi:hypothetical protein
MKFKVSGKNGDFTFASADLPVKPLVVFEGAYGANGQCGDAPFGPASCVMNSTGSTAKCK